MLLVYKGPLEAVYVPDAGLTTERGVLVEVPDQVAASLLLCPDWRKAPPKKEG